MMASIELKCCPFCGAEAESTPNTRFNWQVFCTNDSCFMNTITMYGMATEEDAAKAWNKRALEAESARWIDIDTETYTWKIRCSKCGHERSMLSTRGAYPGYCENCGKKMQGGK